jgi:hypothetical protein
MNCLRGTVGIEKDYGDGRSNADAAVVSGRPGQGRDYLCRVVAGECDSSGADRGGCVGVTPKVRGDGLRKAKF